MYFWDLVREFGDGFIVGFIANECGHHKFGAVREYDCQAFECVNETSRVGILHVSRGDRHLDFYDLSFTFLGHSEVRVHCVITFGAPASRMWPT